MLTGLTGILVTTAAGGILSALLASLVVARLKATWIPTLVSFAVGALLAAVFLDILPHALEHAKSVSSVLATLLGGILLFFLLEKLVLWRHCHHEACEEHGVPHVALEHDHGRSGLMVMVGDTVHNFVDGVMIAAAFLADPQLGIVTALAVVAHEIPQELGDCLVLLHSGYSKRAALAANVLSGCATVVGGLLGYWLLHDLESWLPYILAVAASGMLYVAVADLIPGLHKRPEMRSTLGQMLMIGLGVGAVLLGHELAGHA